MQLLKNKIRSNLRLLKYKKRRSQEATQLIRTEWRGWKTSWMQNLLRLPKELLRLLKNHPRPRRKLTPRLRRKLTPRLRRKLTPRPLKKQKCLKEKLSNSSFPNLMIPLKISSRPTLRKNLRNPMEMMMHRIEWKKWWSLRILWN